MAGKFTIYKTDSGKFRFNLKSGNGEIILVSELYNAKASAKNGIESVKKHAVDEKYFERKMSKKEQPYFVLKAANHQIIGTSEMYSTESGMENGIKSVGNNAPDAKVVDETVEE